MKKLDKEHIKTRDELCQRLTKMRKKLENEINDLNELIRTRWQAIEDLQGSYNGILNEAQDYTSGIVDEIDDFVGKHSERWQEGGQGQKYNEWKERFEQAEFSEVELEEPVDISLDDACEHITILKQLPVEP